MQQEIAESNAVAGTAGPESEQEGQRSIHLSGHKAGVAGIYNRATYATEKRDAMGLWAEHIAAIVNDDRDD